MSKLNEAGLPDAPEGMHWFLNADYDGNISLALMAPSTEHDAGWIPGTKHRVVKSVWVVDAGSETPQKIYAGTLVNRAQDILRWYEIMEENKMWLGVTDASV